jgi:hypothetical protein
MAHTKHTVKEAKEQAKILSSVSELEYRVTRVKSWEQSREFWAKYPATDTNAKANYDRVTDVYKHHLRVLQYMAQELIANA